MTDHPVVVVVAGFRLVAAAAPARRRGRPAVWVGVACEPALPFDDGAPAPFDDAAFAPPVGACGSLAGAPLAASALRTLAKYGVRAAASADCASFRSAVMVLGSSRYASLVQYVVT